MFEGLENAHLYSAKRIVSEFVLQDQTVVTRTGTAFFVLNKAGQICLVTNRHILDAGYDEAAGEFIGAKITKITVEGFIAANEDVNALPVTRSEVQVSVDNILKFAAEYHEDVACFVKPAITVPRGSSSKVCFFLKADDLADDAWIETKLSICDFLAFPGFPQWHDKRDMRPILRTGTISSDPRTNYSDSTTYKGRRVVFEGFSFDGSSGSPIFATQRGFKTEGSIKYSGGFREGKVVGINAGHLRGDYATHSGLSYFVKSSALLDLINS